MPLDDQTKERPVAETRTLVKATVNSLFGKYTHIIEFQNGANFVILYGQNGVGKTKLLEIINYLSNHNFTALAHISFSSAKLTYSDGSVLTAERYYSETDKTEDDINPYRIKLTLRENEKEPIEWNTQISAFHIFLHRETSYTQIAPDLWEDTEDGEVVSFNELTRRYRRPYQRMHEPQDEVPDDIISFCKETPTYLIETQRLRAIQAMERRNQTPFDFATNRQSRLLSRIRQLSASIKDQLNKAQTEHSRVSQQKDRSFPSRVLQAVDSGTKRDSDEIQRSYAEQNKFRDRLARVISVDLSGELAPSSDTSQDWAIALLDLYVKDATEKLEPFRSLLERIELLQEIVNSRLQGKELFITDKDGIIVQRIDDEEMIDLDALSSGEQHEIILLSELLFNVKPGTTVLIDEPEISLHIAWQIAFIPDVERIAEVVGFRFVVATHSPQIINGMWDTTVHLGAGAGDSE